MMTAARDIDGIICLSPDAWADVKRPRHLMTRLAARVPVVYVEPPLCLASVPRLALRGGGRDRLLRALSGTADEVRAGLHVVTPLALVPDHRARALPDSLRTALRVSAHRRACDAGGRRATAVGIARPAWWVGEPRSLSDAASAGPALVYDCVDRWRDFPGAAADPWWRERIVREEDLLFDRAGVVLCSSKGLLEAASLRARGRVELVRNGVDFEHFTSRARRVPVELAGLRRPILGYVGALAEWVDLALIRSIALARPGWSIVLAGPAFAGALSGDSSMLGLLRRLPNVHLLGPRPYEDVPDYVASFDVAMIPFKTNGLTADTNPIKVYEYLAAGIPVVATSLPELVGMEGVAIARDAAAFVSAAEEAIRDDGPSLAARRRRVGRHNSWDERADRAWDAMVTAGPAEPGKPCTRRPRVLVIGSGLPWPLDSGYRIRAFENIRAVSSFADVTVISFSESDDASTSAEALQRALPSAVIEAPVPHRIHIRQDPVALVRAAGVGLLTGRPYKAAKFASAEMRRRVLELVRRERFDVIHAELATWQYVESAARKADRPFSTVLDEHNVEWALLSDHCDGGQFGLLAPLLRVESARTERYEARVCRDADAVVAISAQDARQLSAMAGPAAHVEVVPPVAAQLEESRDEDACGRTSVLLAGELSWLPNQEALRWWCRDILPLVRERMPRVECDVVGRGAPDELIELMRESGVHALGYVPDIRDAYARAAIYIAPFLTGGGVRIKLLDAMRAGIPVVATTIGAKGLDVRSGRELLKADTPEGFADAVCRVLGDRELAASLARAATAYIDAHHGRSNAEERMRRLYASLLPPVSMPFADEARLSAAPVATGGDA